jgi:predicted nucleic acid-binding protein
MKDVVLDAGALIALEKGDALVRGYVRLAEQGDVALTTSSAVVAQVWRDGARQARLARLLSSDLVVEVALDTDPSRSIGLLAASAGTTDVVDGHVALLALERDAIVLTSDPKDIERWGIPGDRIVVC